MLLERYNFIRNRLSKLYEMIQHQPFGVWIAPMAFMDIDELRNRPSYVAHDTLPDTNFYENQQLRSMTLPQIIEILPNMTSPDREIGWSDPNTYIPKVYEGLQEYIMLWCEMIKEVPDVPYPSLEELKKLEDMAYVVFGHYCSIKPFLDDEIRKMKADEIAAQQQLGLAGLMGLFQQTRIGVKYNDGKISFVSYLDNLKASMNWDGHAETGINTPTDSLLAPTAGLGEWYMMN